MGLRFFCCCSPVFCQHSLLLHSHALPRCLSFFPARPASANGRSLLFARPPLFPPPSYLTCSGAASAACSSHPSGAGEDYLSLSDKDLAAQCEVDTFRASGPGGQHRNKTESAVRFKHIPTGLVAQASDDRSQHKNRAYALDRLRQQIAIKVRRPVALTGYKAPPQLVRILPAAKGQRIGPNHSDFARGVQALLDLLSATRGSVSDAAALLGLSTGLFSKVITSDKTLLLAANELRASQGLKALH